MRKKVCGANIFALVARVEVIAIGYQQDTNQVEMVFISFFFFSACLTYAVKLLAF